MKAAEVGSTNARLYCDERVFDGGIIFIAVYVNRGWESRLWRLINRACNRASRWLPRRSKVCDGATKWPLRCVLKRYVPPALTERLESGFAVPVGNWFRGPLCGSAEYLPAPDRLWRDGYLVPGLVQQQWSRFRDRNEGSVDAIRSLLMFQCWLESPGRSGRRAATVDV